ncbi:MAG: cell division protein FtsB [Rhodospirillaceae bacterium]|nr:cell division protein FtsB [Rhodospirillaceae bacterium]|tara:strand:+ start:411 stop:737 length:327 start_codon:yes stop_codon:yes gene_type:complete
MSVTLILLQAMLWLSDNGMQKVWSLESQIAERTAENHQLALRNAALEGEVENLKLGVEAAEERARTDLGMIARGETFFVVSKLKPTTYDRKYESLDSSSSSINWQIIE